MRGAQGRERERERGAVGLAGDVWVGPILGHLWGPWAGSRGMTAGREALVASQRREEWHTGQQDGLLPKPP